jgi:carboxymethylenebutenolidase
MGISEPQRMVIMQQRYKQGVWVLIIAALIAACALTNESIETPLPPTGLSEPTEAIPLPQKTEPSLEPTAGNEVGIATDIKDALAVENEEIEVLSAGKAYLSYLSAPVGEGVYPGILLIHSFNGLEAGYRTMTDKFAAEGYVVLAVGWQTFERSPDDSVVLELVLESLAYLRGRADVDAERIGLTGFCAGGRYTMLFLPQVKAIKAGVAWYGFPYRGDTQPADLIEELTSPMLIIHGTADSPSPIDEIYKYSTVLEEAGKEIELRVYEGEPHGFMLEGGQLRWDAVAQDAFTEMVRFFDRLLK